METIQTEEVQEVQRNEEIVSEPQQIIQVEESKQQYVKTELQPDGFFSSNDDGNCSVKVAVRVRPLVGREMRDGVSRRTCIKTEENSNRLQIGQNEFGFDEVFDTESEQNELYRICSHNQILGCFEGYNATILAYGQTGSGKTHTMGTGSTVGLGVEQIGIVPRVFDFIFEELANRQLESEYSQFSVKCQFLELYQEELHDLIDMGVIDKVTGQSTKQLQIREEKNGTITIQGLKAEEVHNKEECMNLLNKGIAMRVTAATNMNEGSSRSHAIFTLIIEQKIVKEVANEEGVIQIDENGAPVTSEENISAKFHFVDLAGSERIKKTGAQGKQMQEGININKGLLALGNVISALTDEKRHTTGGGGFAPYRDSKLTRILQDSLGGNSRTTMIACVSPSEMNHEESLSTIKYASRARNIKNKPIVNRDANSMLIEALRSQVDSLQMALKEYQILLKDKGIEVPMDFSKQIQEKQQQKAIQSAPQASGAGPSSGGQMVTQQVVHQGASLAELRKMKLQLAQKEKEFKAYKEEQGVNQQKTSDSKLELEKLQKERDEQVMRNEHLSELLTKNNVTVPTESSAATSGAPAVGGKRTQTLVDEYKVKVAKTQQEVEKKNADLILKSKKIAELQTMMKRDEQLLKQKIAENQQLKLQVKRGGTNQSASPATQIQKGASANNTKKQLSEVVDMKSQLMDKLTSQLEDMFEIQDEPDKDKEQTEIEQEGEEAALEGIEETKVAGTVEQKEKILQVVKSQCLAIQKNLDEVMENRWAKKIEELQSQKTRLTKDRAKQIEAAGENQDSAVKLELDKKYKTQIDDLNKQLNEESREKKKKEGSLAKAMGQQEARIKALELELDKQKKARIEIEKQKKYGEERFSKLKATVSKEASQVKKSVQEKDKTVSKLKQELKKTDAKAQQKIAELRGLQKKARDDRERREQQELQENESKGIDIDVIKDWINMNTEAMVKNKELTDYLKDNLKQKEDIEDEMLELGDRLTDLMLERERLECEYQSITEEKEAGTEVDEIRYLEIEQEIDDLTNEQEGITSTLDNLGEHNDFLETKVNELTTEINSFDMDSIQPPRFKGLTSVDVARATLSTFFLVMLDLNVYKKELESKCLDQDDQILDMKTKLAVFKEQNPSAMSFAERQASIRKERQISKIIGHIGGEGIDVMDHSETAQMGLSNEEQTNLTKMSLSKIVSNLRSKLKDEGKKNQNLNLKLDQVIKEKEMLKQKMKQAEKTMKRGGVSTVGQTQSEAPAKVTKPRNRLDTGLSKVVSQQVLAKKKEGNNYEDQPEEKITPTKRLSFKDRRDVMKQSKVTAVSEPSTKTRKPGLPKFSAPQPTLSLQEKRDKIKAEKMLQQTEAAKLAGQESTLPPETILEDEEEEQEEEAKQKFETFIPFGDEEIDEQKLRDLEDQLENGPDASQATVASEDLDMSVTQDEAIKAWQMKEICGLPMDEGVKLIDFDCVDSRMFVLSDDLTLVEIDLENNEVKREVNLSQIVGAEIIQGQKARAFSVFKELDMFAISTKTCVVLFDYESGDPNIVRIIQVPDVTYITWCECVVVLCIEDEDSDDITLSCYELEGEEPEGKITIKRFMSQQILLRLGHQSVHYAAGKQIGKISVPEMTLEYQEDSGHTKPIIDFQVSETTICTTSSDEQMRVFDEATGMLMLAPMEDMECDTLAHSGYHLVTRCGGGEALIIFRNEEGCEELEEVDMIELGETAEDVIDFRMRGGLKANLGPEKKEFDVILMATHSEAGLGLKLLTNSTH